MELIKLICDWLDQNGYSYQEYAHCVYIEDASAKSRMAIHLKFKSSRIRINYFPKGEDSNFNDASWYRFETKETNIDFRHPDSFDLLKSALDESI